MSTMALTNCEETQERLITPTAAARLLGMHYNSIVGWKKKGQIRIVNMPSGRWRIPESELEKLKPASPVREDGPDAAAGAANPKIPEGGEK